MMLGYKRYKHGLTEHLDGWIACVYVCHVLGKYACLSYGANHHHLPDYLIDGWMIYDLRIVTCKRLVHTHGTFPPRLLPATQSGLAM